MKQPKPVVFYHFTDADTAERIVATGFGGVGFESADAAVTLFESPLDGSGEAVLRVSLPLDVAARAAPFVERDGMGGRRWVVPLEIALHAQVVRLDGSPGD